MLSSWTTVRKEGRAEIEERRSRFIALCFPIEDAQDAETRLAGLRAEMPDASHHVFVWQTVLPERAGRFSDDGEPQGTAAAPILNLLKQREVDQAALMVIRYFGGTLLGAGGLIRAYGKAAALALEAAEPLRMVLQKRLRLLAAYEHYDRLRYQLEKAGFAQEEASFGLDILWRLASPPERLEELRELCSSVSAGLAVLEEEDEVYVATEAI